MNLSDTRNCVCNLDTDTPDSDDVSDIFRWEQDWWWWWWCRRSNSRHDWGGSVNKKKHCQDTGGAEVKVKRNLWTLCNRLQYSITLCTQVCTTAGITVHVINKIIQPQLNINMIQIISHNLYPAEHTEFLLYQTKFKTPSKLLSEFFVMTLSHWPLTMRTLLIRAKL